MFAASKLTADGFVPDVIVAHCGWGEHLPLRAIFPNSKIAIYCEFYFRSEGQDVHFDPEAPRLGADGVVTLQCRNASTLLALAEADLGISPTHWQKSTYPTEFLGKIRVAHEGIDTQRAAPNGAAKLTLPSGRVLTNADEVVTYVTRSLERTRGTHIFLRALPRILRERPSAEVVIIGGDDASYGPNAPTGKSWREVFLSEMEEPLDLSRVHFLGRVTYSNYIATLQISSAHVYLTYPFVLSWSLLEAMSVGCRIVASDTPPVREVMDGTTGSLTPFFDVQALSTSVIDVLESPANYDSRAAQARRTVIARFERTAGIQRWKSMLNIY